MMHLLNFVLAALAVTGALAAPVDTNVQARNDIPVGPALGQPSIPVTPALGGDLHFGRNEPGKPITDHQQSLPKTQIFAPAMGGGDLHLKREETVDHPWSTRTGANAIPTWLSRGPPASEAETVHPWATRTGANAIPTWLSRGPPASVETVAPWATRTAANAIPTWLTRGPESS